MAWRREGVVSLRTHPPGTSESAESTACSADTFTPGALAHPVERLICIQKAASSRLAGSTPPNPGRFTLSGMTGSPTTSKGGAAL